MLIDEAEIIVEGGLGGKGMTSFFPGKNGPDGGNGGNGGNIYATINPQLVSLYKYTQKRKYKGNRGKGGQSNTKTGACGEDIFLELPVGVTLTDLDTGEVFELTEKNQPLLIAKGGKGGLGNTAFKSSVHRTPMTSQVGTVGQTRKLKVILRLIADFGLIGLPNAGKSSLLNALTAAQAKVANYPFTTLGPNLGVLGTKIIADIPGLIEGASQGKGLGIKFLKHVEKVNLLVHCIAVDSEDLEKEYNIVRNELAEYNSKLLEKKMYILITKKDLVTEEELQQKIKLLEKINPNILSVSILDEESIFNFKNTLLNQNL